VKPFPVVRVAVIAAVAVGAWAITQGTRGPRWQTLQSGVEFAMIRGEPYCRSGSSDIAVLRLDPARVRLRAHHYTLQPDGAPLPLKEWQRRTRALAVFNAGQYYPDLSYMGILVCDGRVVSSRLHPRFRAALVASPVSGGPGARVLDLEQSRLDPERPGWRQVAQSFMLFDRGGATRVRKTSQVARRTVVAEDRHGHLLTITSEGGYTLWDFARLLQSSPLQLSHAMAMDGGHEAELYVKVGGFRYASLGPPGDALESEVALPAVISVSGP